jgi:uncharacterized protein DUF3311
VKKRAWYWLLVVPFVATLWPPLYNRAGPPFIGLPFFYWYQLLWVILTSALLAIVLRLTREPADE